MKAQLLGYQRIKGTSSKTGNEYDFIQLHYSYFDKSVEGLAVGNTSLSPDDVSINDLKKNIGSNVDIEFNQRGRAEGIVFLPDGKVFNVNM